MTGEVHSYLVFSIKQYSIAGDNLVCSHAAWQTVVHARALLAGLVDSRWNQPYTFTLPVRISKSMD